MAKLGFRKLEDMVGRTDKLIPWKAIEHWKAKGLDLTPILHQPEVGRGSRTFPLSRIRITAWKNPWT